MPKLETDCYCLFELLSTDSSNTANINNNPNSNKTCCVLVFIILMYTGYMWVSINNQIAVINWVPLDTCLDNCITSVIALNEYVSIVC